MYMYYKCSLCEKMAVIRAYYVTNSYYKVALYKNDYYKVALYNKWLL
jgi:hypothetical protein